MAVDAAGRDQVKPGAWTGLSRRRLRGWLYQAIVLLVLGVIVAIVVVNLRDNLAKRGLSLGFGFLSQEAGFAIGFSVVSFSSADTYWRVFTVGIANTLLASGLGILLATIIGFVVGIARLSRNWSVSRAALLYVELVRNLPLLLHVLIWYNFFVRAMPPPRRAISLGELVYVTNRGIFLPAVTSVEEMVVVAAIAPAILIGAASLFFGRAYRNRTGRSLPVAAIALASLGLTLLISIFLGATLQFAPPKLEGFNFVGGIAIAPELAALVTALAIYNASFIAELVRASIESVGRGQRDAAAALGLRRSATIRLVIIPQALRVLIPPLSNQYLHLLKASSLGTVIGYPDLVNVFTGTALNQTGRAVEIVLMTMAVYLVVSAVIALGCGVFNRMTQIVER